jgi:16S rRNA (guanine527-N7)-methyltransferase
MSVEASGGRSGEELAALVAGAAALGLPLDAAQTRRFDRFRALLIEWNERFNLTAITDPAEILTRHFLDSLTCVLALPPERRAEPLRLLDVGSGAGLPGLALAIACPAWQVTSLEATAKKVRFQDAVIAALGLTNARAVAGRAEELARRQDWRGQFDVVTARALAALPVLLEYCAPFACVGGYVIAPKKGDVAEELAAGARAAELLGARLLAPLPVTLPALADGRMLVVARQERLCPPQYPRAAGAPVKRPLGA